MKLQILDGEFCVCKLKGEHDADIADIFKKEFCFFAKTDCEESLVCKTFDAPLQAAKIDGGWRGMRIVGQLDFSLVGILAKISGILVNENIPIYAVSTFDTDYVFIKEHNLQKAVKALEAKRYTVVNEKA